MVRRVEPYTSAITTFVDKLKKVLDDPQNELEKINDWIKTHLEELENSLFAEDEDLETDEDFNKITRHTYEWMENVIEKCGAREQDGKDDSKETTETKKPNQGVDKKKTNIGKGKRKNREKKDVFGKEREKTDKAAISSGKLCQEALTGPRSDVESGNEQRKHKEDYIQESLKLVKKVDHILIEVWLQIFRRQTLNLSSKLLRHLGHDLQRFEGVCGYSLSGVYMKIEVKMLRNVGNYLEVSKYIDQKIKKHPSDFKDKQVKDLVQFVMIGKLPKLVPDMGPYIKKEVADVKQTPGVLFLNPDNDQTWLLSTCTHGNCWDNDTIKIKMCQGHEEFSGRYWGHVYNKPPYLETGQQQPQHQQEQQEQHQEQQQQQHQQEQQEQHQQQEGQQERGGNMAATEVFSQSQNHIGLIGNPEQENLGKQPQQEQQHNHHHHQQQQQQQLEQPESEGIAEATAVQHLLQSQTSTVNMPEKYSLFKSENPHTSENPDYSWPQGDFDKTTEPTEYNESDQVSMAIHEHPKSAAVLKQELKSKIEKHQQQNGSARKRKSAEAEETPNNESFVETLESNAARVGNYKENHENIAGRNPMKRTSNFDTVVDKNDQHTGMPDSLMNMTPMSSAESSAVAGNGHSKPIGHPEEQNAVGVESGTTTFDSKQKQPMSKPEENLSVIFETGGSEPRNNNPLGTSDDTLATGAEAGRDPTNTDEQNHQIGGPEENNHALGPEEWDPETNGSRNSLQESNPGNSTSCSIAENIPSDTNAGDPAHELFHYDLCFLEVPKEKVKVNTNPGSPIPENSFKIGSVRKVINNDLSSKVTKIGYKTGRTSGTLVNIGGDLQFSLDGVPVWLNDVLVVEQSHEYQLPEESINDDNDDDNQNPPIIKLHSNAESDTPQNDNEEPYPEDAFVKKGDSGAIITVAGPNSTNIGIGNHLYHYNTSHNPYGKNLNYSVSCHLVPAVKEVELKRFNGGPERITFQPTILYG